MKIINKYLLFVEICAYFLGAIGGLGWALYEKSYVCAVGIVILAAMAFPELRNAIKKLME